MYTDADKLRDRAAANVKEAIRSLAEIVVDEVCGTTDYTAVYRIMLSRSLRKLIEVHEEMESRDVAV